MPGERPRGGDDRLIAVTAGANRSKDAKGPEDWRPPDEDYWCRYATDWTEVKQQWALRMTEREAEVVVEMLDTCDETPEVEIWEALGTTTGSISRSQRAQCTGLARRRRRPGSREFRGAAGAGKGTRRPWFPAPGTGTAMV